MNAERRSLLKGARTGDPLALVELGYAFYAGRIFKRNYARAAQCFARLAIPDNGHRDSRLEAQYMLAWMSAHGQGVKRNDRYAAAAYARLGRTDHSCAVQSLTNLADMYLKGIGVRQDGMKALACLRRAARRDVTGEAATAIAHLYHMGGAGVPKDPEKAAEWLKPAMQAGKAEAFYLAGVMTYKGEGYPANERIATNLIGRAAALNYAPAKRDLTALLDRQPDIQQLRLLMSLKERDDLPERVSRFRLRPDKP